MDQIGIPLLHKAIWILVLAPTVLTIVGLKSDSRLLRRLAIAVWIGGVSSAAIAGVLWLIGYDVR